MKVKSKGQHSEAERETHIQFNEIFNLNDFQHLQDLLSDATGVASIILNPDGRPLTRPSNFCRLFSDIILKTEKGYDGFYNAEHVVSSSAHKGLELPSSLNGIFWKASTEIIVGGRHIASWLLCQVRNVDCSEMQMEQYAGEIGAEKTGFMEALNDVPVMSAIQFAKISKMLSAFSAELSLKASHNLQLQNQIAGHEEATAQLHDSEERYRILMQTANEAIITSNAEGIITGWNLGAEKMFGYTEDEISGKLLAAIMPSDYIELFKKGIQNVALGHERHITGNTVALHGLHKNGHAFPLELSLAESETSSGRIFTGVIRDITKRRKVEEALSNERLLLRTLIDNIPDSIYTKDLQCRKTLANIAEVHNMGAASEAEIIGKDDFDFYPAELAEKFFADDQSVIRTGLPVLNKEEFILDQQGNKRWLLTSKLPLHDKDNQIIGLVGIGRDITTRRIIEDTLRENEEKYRLIFEHSPMGLLSFDTKGIIVTCNTRFAQIIGSPIENLIGMDMLRLPDQKLVAAIRSALSGTPQAYEDVYTSVTANKVSMGRALFSPVIGSNGQVKGGIGIIEELTDRRKAEAALRESENKYRAIFDNVQDVFYQTDLSGIILEISPSIKHFAEFDRVDMIGSPVYSLYYNPDDRVKLLEALMINGELRDYELMLKTRKGAIKYVSINASLIYNAAGQPTHINGALRDITDRKLAESHREQQLHYTKALNKIAEVIIFNDNSEEILENANRIIGETLKVDRVLIYDISFEKKYITGLCEWLRMDHPDIAITKGEYPLEMFLSPFEEIRRNQKFLHSQFDAVSEFFARDKSGEMLHSHFKIKSLIWYPFAFYDQGYYLFTLNQILDQRQWTQEEFEFLDSVANQVSLALIKIRLLDERNKAEALLRDSEEQNRTIIQTAMDGFCLVDLQGKLLEVNETYCRMSGYSAPELLSMHLTDLDANEQAQETASQIQQVILNGESRFETHHRRKDGSVFTAEISVQYRPSNGGQMVAFIHDITDRVKSEGELRHKNQQLSLLNAEKDKFFSVIAHDLRSPFHVFMGLTQIMAEELPSLTMDEIQNMAVLMRKSSANLFRLLSNLLEWSSMQRGLTVFKPSAFQLEQKISESLAVVLEVANRKNITLKYDIAPGLMVFGDGNMIEGILRNLVTNATKFTPAGGDVLVSARLNPENLIEIAIKDSGIGMNQHMIDHLFNIDENTSREGTEGEPSTGLGLIICKDFVEKHGGRLWVESQVGKGSTFHFTISQSNSPVDVRMKNESATGVKTTGHGGKLKILIAEDDESSEMLIRMTLKVFSNDIICVRNGLDAVDTCRIIHDVDLVMMDIKMPVMDGFEATRQIRKFNNDVVIIVQTAFESADAKERAFEAGCNDFIPKPLDAALLKSVIQRHFNLK